MTFWALHLLVSFVLDSILAIVVSLRMVDTHWIRKILTAFVLMVLSIVYLDKIVIWATRILDKPRDDDLRDYGNPQLIKLAVQ